MSVRMTGAAGNLIQRLTNTPALSSGSYCGWVSIDAVSTVQSFMMVQDSAGSGDFVLVETDSGGQQMQGSLNPDGAAAQVPMVLLTPMTWYFFAASFNGAAMRVYWSDAAGKSPRLSNGSGAGAFVHTSSRFFIGADNGSTSIPKGRLAYFKIWSAVLTQEEFELEMMHGRPQRTSQLNGFYPMLDQLSAPHDFSTNNPMTPGATPPSTDFMGPPIAWL